MVFAWHLLTDRHCGTTPALDDCLALVQNQKEENCPGLNAYLISALYFNWHELLTCSLITCPGNLFTRDAKDEACLF